VCISLLPHTRHMPLTSLSTWSDHPNDICWTAKIMKLPDTYFPPVLLTPALLDRNIFLSTPCWILLYRNCRLNVLWGVCSEYVFSSINENQESFLRVKTAGA
jgi:hypothetical protein